MLWDLFIFFMKIGFLSFGGGYAVIPMIHYGMSEQGWINDQEFQEIVSLAGMSPGPIATNCATLIGYRIAGPAGSAAATFGIILPSLLIIVIIAAFFYRLRHNRWVKAAFYGLRPIVTGLIAFAAFRFGFPRGFEAIDWQTAAMLLICLASLFGLLKYKLHPLLVIAASAIAGVVLL
ncbi:chromate transporter [Paenibacillus nasutitermitis]|uniref:Chromate transporter n=1 Tax=Paenibacillus nasutitermitis TaxID=1652958 RepID=A0A916Z7D4_9BACL|nr:chromate transporter [Paenibacillus nasutitermitis]GGD78624.1 chromate transporter [Paenibacillus nasutitermitis]